MSDEVLGTLDHVGNIRKLRDAARSKERKSHCDTDSGLISPSEPDSRSKVIGRRITLMRQKKGIQMRELAEKSGITQQWISRIESGNDAKLTTYYKVADGLGVDIVELFQVVRVEV